MQLFATVAFTLGSYEYFLNEYFLKISSAEAVEDFRHLVRRPGSLP